MARKKMKLELTWIGKSNRPRLEPRILLPDDDASHLQSSVDAPTNTHSNLVIEGDNLLALKALEQDFSNKVKCIYIDPPYNTRSTDMTYDDNVEHSIWLSLMRARLEILWRLLTTANGVLLISINDDECHYLKVLCDELFGRQSFVAALVWNYEGNTDNQAKIINYHEYILVYSKTGTIDEPEVIDPNVPDSSKLFRAEIRNTVIKNGPKNPIKPVTLPAGFPASFEAGVIRKQDVTYPQYDTDIEVVGGETAHSVTGSTGWSSRKILTDFIDAGCQPVSDSKGQETVFELTRTGAIEAVKKREQKKGHFLSVLRGFGTVNQMRLLLGRMGLKFSYPKPVGLVAYLIEAFSGPDDIILDSFAGSGTTAHAVLQLNLEKGSRRRFILVELDTATSRNVLVPRLRAVIDGHRKAKVPPHGGGFRFYRLAPSLLEEDK
jgi:adenine-specific DNA-methyltransferase